MEMKLANLMDAESELRKVSWSVESLGIVTVLMMATSLENH